MSLQCPRPHAMILFLDFDGVLHPDAAYKTANGHLELRAEGAFFMWVPYLVDVLADFPKVRIVLSTSWVRQLSFNRARRYLPAQLSDRVIGATYHSAMARQMDGFAVANPWDASSRYQQIARYVERAKISNWLALDDDDEGWPDAERNRLVCTDPSRGLSNPQTISQLRSALEQRVRMRGTAVN